jgi:DEAD/DEAH box helicase domain-containing protein
VERCPDLPEGFSAVFLYDAVEGGIGITERVAEKWEDLLSRCFDTVSKCSCEDGCPACIFSASCSCRNDRELIDKRACQYVLSELCAAAENA